MSQPAPLQAPVVPAHAALIARIFDERQAWSTVERRLRVYPAIAQHFDIEMLRAAHGRRPFHVHYMAWRLGTWTNERNFEVLDHLLAHGASLPGWKHEQHLLTSTDFGHYWSLIWQLQVAALLSAIGTDVHWPGGNAPDLGVTIDGKPLFVECYSFQKRFGILEFIVELCRWLDSDIGQQRNLAIPISFGKTASGEDRNDETFLHDLFTGLQEPGVLDAARERAKVRQPVDLPLPSGTKNLWLVLKGAGQSWPSLGRNGSAEPERFLDFVVAEVLRIKTNKNRLASHRPNVVVANPLIGPDYQMSRFLRPNYTPPAHLPHDIDALALSATGIDAEVAMFEHGYFRAGHHSILEALRVPSAARTRARHQDDAGSPSPDPRQSGSDPAPASHDQ